MLATILEDLNGEQYQGIREKVNGVGQQLIPKNVAEHIALKLRQALNAAWTAAVEEIQQEKWGKFNWTKAEKNC